MAGASPAPLCAASLPAPVAPLPWLGGASHSIDPSPTPRTPAPSTFALPQGQRFSLQVKKVLHEEKSDYQVRAARRAARSGPACPAFLPI